MTKRSFCVAIDGPAAAGKGTISKAVAAHFGFAHLDTGLLYRAVGAGVLAGGDAVTVAKTLDPAQFDQDSLRTPEVAQAASRVAVDPDVRSALLQFQRDFAEKAGCAVLDGRDIGTVVAPAADAKLFITASADVRAQRRFLELSGKGMDVTLEGVLADVKARDARDRSREAAPLVAAKDAVLIDTSELSIEQAIGQAIAAIEKIKGA